MDEYARPQITMVMPMSDMMTALYWALVNRTELAAKETTQSAVHMRVINGSNNLTVEVTCPFWVRFLATSIEDCFFFCV